jgi:ureidoacrylate peracid hydrolase
MAARNWEAVMHKIEIPEAILKRVEGRRGPRGAFGGLDGPRTALVVVDLQNAFMLPGFATEVPLAREIVPNVNRLAAAVRENGGEVVWVKMTLQPDEAVKWSVFFDHVLGPDFAQAELSDLAPGTHGNALYADLDVRPDDLTVEKSRFSAFIQGSSDLDRILRARGIDTVIITGTVTNTCCESSARDAMMLNYKVVFVSDANAAITDDEHNATLANMIRIFGDVRSTDEVVAMLAEGAPARMAAAG